MFDLFEKSFTQQLVSTLTLLNSSGRLTESYSSKHWKVHFIFKLLNCPYCDAAYSSSQYLRSHIATCSIASNSPSQQRFDFFHFPNIMVSQSKYHENQYRNECS